MIYILTDSNLTEKSIKIFNIIKLRHNNCDIKLVLIDESLFDAATAVSGCGPAFCYMFIEALANGGIEAGLPKDKALKLAAQTVLGAGKMVRDSGVDPTTLRENVCSKGGSTIEGVKSLFESDLDSTVKKAVNASYNRTKELGKK